MVTSGPAGAGPVLELNGVSKHYAQADSQVVVLDGVDLAISPGEFVALIGPSGSGKSTLLHIGGGLDEPSSGSVRVEGQLLGQMGPGERARLRRRRIGFIFQFFQLLPTLSVEENVALPLIFEGRRSVRDVTDPLLTRLGLADKTRRYPGELSGGEMQRVAIARALVAGAPLILADEPTGNLDSVTGAEVLELLKHNVRDAAAALLLVTHDERAAAQADRVLALRDGRLATL